MPLMTLFYGLWLCPHFVAWECTGCLKHLLPTAGGSGAPRHHPLPSGGARGGGGGKGGPRPFPKIRRGTDTAAVVMACNGVPPGPHERAAVP